MNAAKKYNLNGQVKHMIELYELNLSNKKFNHNKTDILYISNEFNLLERGSKI